MINEEYWKKQQDEQARRDMENKHQVDAVATANTQPQNSQSRERVVWRWLLLVALIIVAAFFAWALYQIGSTARKAGAAADHVNAVAARVDKHVDDEFLMNLKNDVNVGAAQGQIAINQSTEVTKSLVGLIDNLKDKSNDALLQLPTSIKLLNSNLQELHDHTIPTINDTASAATGTINDLGKLTQHTDEQLQPVFVRLDGLLLSLQARVDDPAIIKLIQDTAATMGAVHVTADEIREAIPQMRDDIHKQLLSTTRLTDNGGDLLGEGAKYMHGINKPLTRAEKIRRALITAAAIAIPALARH